MDASTADAVNDILRGVQEPGGFGYDNGLALSQPSAGKTGTIQNNMAVWFMGYTPTLATAAMIAGANDDGTWVTLNGQTVGGTYISSAFGSTVAGPMWGDAMHVIQQWLPDDDFTPPSGQDVAGVLTEIPDTGGMGVDQATSLLESLGFVVELGGYRAQRVRRGHRRLHAPRPRLRRRERHDRDHLPVHRRPAAQAPQARRW